MVPSTTVFLLQYIHITLTALGQAHTPFHTLWYHFLNEYYLDIAYFFFSFHLLSSHFSLCFHSFNLSPLSLVSSFSSLCFPAHLQDDLLVNGKLCNDVSQEQVPAVFTGGIHACFGQQARPGECHEAPQLAVAWLVVVVNVVGRVLHQQGGELQQADSQRVEKVSLLLWVQDLGEDWKRCGKIVEWRGNG